MTNATGTRPIANFRALWLLVALLTIAAPVVALEPPAGVLPIEAVATGERPAETTGANPVPGQPAIRQEPASQDPAQQPPPETQEPPAQDPATQPPAADQLPQGPSILQYVEALPPSEAFVFRFQNRVITTLRARVLGRSPRERAEIAVNRLNEILDQGGIHEVDVADVETAKILRVDEQLVIAIVEEDIELLASETVEEEAQAAAALLQIAIREAEELRNPSILLAAAVRVALATLLFVAILALVMRLRTRLIRSVVEAASERLSDSGTTGRILWAEVRFDIVARRVLLVASGVFVLATTYVWLTYALRQFPYTRPWGERLGERLFAAVLWIVQGFANAIPGLFTILMVVLLTRLATRVVRAFFAAVHDGRVRIVGLDPEAARPTRQLVIGVLWILALVISYPYIPGSGTEAFRGISVFLGVVLSIGSTGVVNQAMSGLILMYSSSMKPGEYVVCGDVEGTVMQLGMLSTRIRTLHRELVTVPNSVVLMRETTNYSRLASNGVPIKTTITLGYDLPWRQVHAILRLAAERTEEIREEPEPRVLQRELSDFYVAYQLIAYVDEPRTRPRVLSELHANILDVCNEYGVQILSPHYVADPDEPAVVPRERWVIPPATPDEVEDTEPE